MAVLEVQGICKTFDKNTVVLRGIDFSLLCRIFQIQISGFYIKCMPMADQYFFPFDQKNPFRDVLTAITVSRHLFHYRHREFPVQLFCIRPAVSQMNDHIRT